MLSFTRRYRRNNITRIWLVILNVHFLFQFKLIFLCVQFINAFAFKYIVTKTIQLFLYTQYIYVHEFVYLRFHICTEVTYLYRQYLWVCVCVCNIGVV